MCPLENDSHPWPLSSKASPCCFLKDCACLDLKLSPVHQEFLLFGFQRFLSYICFPFVQTVTKLAEIFFFFPLENEAQGSSEIERWWETPFRECDKWNVKITLRLENNLWDALETENLNTRRRKFCLTLAEGSLTFTLWVWLNVSLETFKFDPNLTVFFSNASKVACHSLIDLNGGYPSSRSMGSTDPDCLQDGWLSSCIFSPEKILMGHKSFNVLWDKVTADTQQS